MTLAVLCPGQGAQHSRLLDFAGSHADSARVVEEAADALDADLRAWSNDDDAIYRNANAQPLIVVAQVAQWAFLRGALPTPAALAGYSVGELACHGVGGGLRPGEMARLARARAEAMDAAAQSNPGGLIGIHGLTRAAARRMCESARAFIAIVIADDAYVIGGDEVALARVREHGATAGAKVTELRVAIASHTPLLAAAAEAFRAALERSQLAAPTIPIVAGIDAGLVTSRERAIATLSAQIARTVEWAQCLDALHERGCRVFLELGPGRALSRMVRERLDGVDARAVDEFRSLENAARWVTSRV